MNIFYFIGIKSNEIEVRNGDRLELTSTWVSRFSFSLMMITMFFMIFIPSVKYSIIILFSVAALLMILMLLIDGFRLTILQKK